MKKRIIGVIVIMIVFMQLLWFANQKYILKKTSNLNINTQEYNLNSTQMFNVECYNIHNMLLYKNGLLITNASEYGRVDDYDFQLVFSHNRINYFSSGSDKIVHTDKLHGKNLEIIYYDRNLGESMNIFCVFELVDENYILQGQIKDVYINKENIKLANIDYKYLKPIDSTVKKIVEKFIVFS